VPQLEYIVVTTHPTLKVQAGTAKTQAYIRVACLGDLQKSKIIPDEAVQGIREAQSKLKV
jgi:hypothetical protein